MSLKPGDRIDGKTYSYEVKSVKGGGGYYAQ